MCRPSLLTGVSQSVASWRLDTRLTDNTYLAIVYRAITN
jgi:hypothetical protein